MSPRTEPDMDPYGSIQDLFRRLKPEDREVFSRDDKGMARLFAECFRDKLRYNVTAENWYQYDGKIWKPDTSGMVTASYAKMFSDALFFYAFQMLDGKEKSSFLKFIGRYGDYSRRKTLIADARSETFFSNADLDRDGSLYNLQDGVLNLDTLELLPHRPEYLLSKISNVHYDPDARSPLFEKVLSEVLEKDSNKIYYLLKWFGLSLTEDTSHEEMLILLGVSTRNGKSTLLETVSYMHGGSAGYALSMPPETLAQRKSRDSRTASGDIARLDGCRMLVTSEPPKGMLLDAALLKTLSGRDTITARHLYEREFQFEPKFKLFMNTNHLPHIQDDTLFTSGRIKVIEFNRHFTPEEQDTTLKTRLRSRENLSGIFNCCVEGLKMYREDGLEPPKVIIQAVESYRASNDKLQNFISECMVRTGKNTGAGVAYQAYRRWCLDNGYGVESKGNFFAELKRKSLFSPLGTVSGKSVKNVLVGYELSDIEFAQMEFTTHAPF